MRIPPIIALAFGALILAVYAVVNIEFKQGVIYVITLLVAIVGIQQLGQKLNVIDADFKDIAAGIALTAGFILLGAFITNISLGIPEVQSLAGIERYVVIAILAPIAEELFFIVFLRQVLLLGAMSTNPLMADAIVVVTFAAFHKVAYGGSFASNSGAFLGAILFRTASLVVFRATGNILSTIIGHAGINAWILATKEGLPT